MFSNTEIEIIVWQVVTLLLFISPSVDEPIQIACGSCSNNCVAIAFKKDLLCPQKIWIRMFFSFFNNGKSIKVSSASSLYV